MSDGRQHTPHVFKSSGISVTLKHVSNIAVNEALAVLEKPQAPVTEVKNADGTVRYERNKTHPDYLEDLNVYTMKAERLLRTVYVKLAVEYELTEADKAEVRSFRDLVKESSGAEVKLDDKTLFITFYAIRTDEDYSDFVAACQGKSTATDPKSTLGTPSMT